MSKYLSGEYTPTQKLYHALFGELPKRDLDEADLPELYDIFQTLYDQRQDIIKMRFGLGCDKMTRKAIAAELSINENRVELLESKAIKALQHESRAKRIRPLFYTYGEMRAEIRERDEQIATLAQELHLTQRDNCRLRQWLRESGETPDMANLPALNWPIADMGLSDRVYSCLTRAGMKTVRDVVLQHNRGGDESGLAAIRNMTSLSVGKVLAALRKLEIPLNKPDTYYHE